MSGDWDWLVCPPVNLAQPRLGTRVIAASDDFFAAKERLIDPGEPVFIAGKYDANGKWMDGWESRRRRGPGHDHCIIRLGAPAILQSAEIDTRHFTGNYAPAAAIDLCRSEAEIPPENAWRSALPVTPLAGDSRKFVTLPEQMAATHVRLNIYPDGGVARLRLFGRPVFDPAAVEGEIDLAAMETGGWPVACNDAHFGAVANLIAPGRGRDMGDGWETRRRRTPGHDWAILALACPGEVTQLLIDTAHFKGNYPDRISVQAAHAPGKPAELLVPESLYWPGLLPETPVGPDAEHRFTDALAALGPVTHVKLNLHPDGGVSRLRVLGRPAL